MPTQKNSGLHGIPWTRCERCGVDVRTSQVTRQNGLLLCTINGCVDNPLAWAREGIIQSVIEGSPDEMQVAEILKNSDSNDVDSTESL